MRLRAMALRLGAGLAAAAILGGAALAQPKTIAGSVCTAPPALNCVDGNCGRDRMGELGQATEPKTGRKFFLDFPCDLKPGEKVVFILSLHGAGSIDAWQRYYFPALNYKEKYRLVIAAPSAAGGQPLRAWAGPADDQFLQNVSDLVFAEFGKANIKSFWLAGHSQGGLTSNRIVCNDYFAKRVDGWLSLSGGRIGRAQIPPDFFPRNPDGSPGGPPAPRPGQSGPGAAADPTCDISFIFSSGEKEIVALPATSPWAEKYACATRVRRPDIVDDKPGFVASADQSRGASWGRHARPGRAEFYVYPGCKGGRVVADVLRLDKGHTEGLEPKVTEELIKLMVAAPGGKAQGS